MSNVSLHKSVCYVSVQCMHIMSCRPGEILENDWPKRLLHFGQDIASGVSYLSSKAFVHRDLAARNILVAEDRTCKVS